MDFKAVIINMFKDLKKKVEFSFKSVSEQMGNLSRKMETRNTELNGNSITEKLQTELRGKLIVLNASIRNEERLEINAKSIKLKKLEKKKKKRKRINKTVGGKQSKRRKCKQIIQGQCKRILKAANF